MLIRLSADWLLSGTGKIIARGALLADRQGRLFAVGPDAAIPKSDQVPTEHFPGAVLLPGLVNAHTHLELTGLEGQAGEADFAEWIRTIIQLKANRDHESFLAAARQGLRQGFASGVTTIADTGSSGAPIEAMAELGGSGIAFLEVFGPDPADCANSIAAYQIRLDAQRRFESPRIRLGVSPHAPYSVSGLLYQATAQLAQQEHLPIAVHVAESAAESELLENAQGPFARMWESRGIPLPSIPGRTPIAWLNQHEVLGPSTLCIHAVRVTTDDVRLLSQHQCGIAMCPRSNRRHGHGDPPIAAFADARLRMGLGTDSAASVSPPDLLAEARAAATLGALSADQALHLVTRGAAEAIGLGSLVGSLEPGKWADAAVIRVPSPAAAETIAMRVLESGPDDVLATYIGGRLVYRQ